MLKETQVKRLLLHCKRIGDHYEALEMKGHEGKLYSEMMTNQGWCEALTLVLGDSNHPISDKPIKEK